MEQEKLKNISHEELISVYKELTEFIDYLDKEHNNIVKMEEERL